MKRLIVPVLAVVLLTLSCKGPAVEEKRAGNPQPAAPAPAPETKAVEENAPDFTHGVEPAKDIVSSTKKLQEAQFWSATISSETLPELTGTMEYVAPDRYRITKPDGEIVAIGRESWVKENGQWARTDIDLGGALVAQRPKLTADVVERLKGTKLLRKEPVAGRPASVYTYEEGGTQTTVWIADGSGLLLKTVTEFEVDGQKHKRTTVYDYDKPVKIEAPKISG